MQNGHCHYKAENEGATDAGFIDIEKGDEDALKMASASVGPISVAIDASHTSFQVHTKSFIATSISSLK